MTSFTNPDAVTPALPRDSKPEHPTSVQLLGETIRNFVQTWGVVWVEGEITSWNLRGGHAFARLKDTSTDATISMRVWSSVLSRTTEKFAIGDRVIVAVKADYFVKGGDLSFTVSQIRHVGLGEQLEKLERLKKQLASEGLFDSDRKKPLPFLPQLIGLVTGANSDAEKDVLRNAELRWPGVRFRIIHAAVQGDRCAPEVTAALQTLDEAPDVDVIIIARGGGDPQHLLGFSDEALLRAAAAANTPIVSAIGHENDRPLLDEIADVRASTPTDAAKRVVPDVAEQRAIVSQLRSRMLLRLSTRINHDFESLNQLRSRPVLREPERMLTERSQEIWLALSRGRDELDRQIIAAEQSTTQLTATLRALSPLATLKRGYAIVRDAASGNVITKVEQAPDGALLKITLSDGKINAEAQSAQSN